MLSLASSTIKLAASFVLNNQQQKVDDEDRKLVQYSLSQVAQHSSSRDCWIVIGNKIYDVTRYIVEVIPPCEKQIECVTFFDCENGKYIA